MRGSGRAIAQIGSIVRTLVSINQRTKVPTTNLLYGFVVGTLVRIQEKLKSPLQTFCIASNLRDIRAIDFLTVLTAKSGFC